MWLLLANDAKAPAAKAHLPDLPILSRLCIASDCENFSDGTPSSEQSTAAAAPHSSVLSISTSKGIAPAAMILARDSPAFLLS
ncbi:hypothetical protein FIBSPDRAFT_847325 [Athelia psychrophila]|uniref:Uncharacterized protein n=1 Tax=Athelia psychrophila TaxID=1759441 RepID=A0A166W5Z8_9AGAM|nr:hypothetical protein FIBSPDRAFT_877754 [Fibularhizoctonia sp. CBS 109695]KZP33414.1 hypothetical protein FIBSPDRAFT_847325 [Fibularhizoctonia sp. CBS 109695]